MYEPQDLMADGSPLIEAAKLGKLRLVRLLVEGGAHVDEQNRDGETPLLAACKALRGEPTGPGTLKLLRYLLENQADPNAQDRLGRTPLMYSCMERAGAPVASTLISAGADPSMEDFSGASALVYAINAQHQPTLQVLLDACRAKGRDIIIIATEMGVSGGPLTRRYLNVLPSPDTSPVPCMSPSDIIVKTGSPSSPEAESVFNFRAPGKRGSCSESRLSPNELCPGDQSCISPPRQRTWSKPWLAIHNLAELNQVYQDARRERELEKREGETRSLHHFCQMEGTENAEPRPAVGERKEESSSAHQLQKEISTVASQHLFFSTREQHYQAAQRKLSSERSLTPEGFTLDPYRELSSVQSALHFTEGSHVVKGDITTQKCSGDRPLCTYTQLHGGRRNTLPSLTPPLLHLPRPLSCYESRLQVPLPVLPVAGDVCRIQRTSSPTFKGLRPGILPPLPVPTSSSILALHHFSSSVTPLPPSSERGRRSPRRHSIQLEPLRRGEEE